MANAVVHFEIPADDVARATAFYEKTFGWKIKKYPMPPGGQEFGPPGYQQSGSQQPGYTQGYPSGYEQTGYQPGYQQGQQPYPQGYPGQQGYPGYPGYPGYTGAYPGAYPPYPGAPYGIHPATGLPFSEKSKLIAGLLQMLIPLGIGRMYMGHTGLGIAQLIVTLVTCGVGALWPFIDGIVILVTDAPTDADGRVLRS